MMEKSALTPRRSWKHRLLACILVKASGASKHVTPSIQIAGGQSRPDKGKGPMSAHPRYLEFMIRSGNVQGLPDLEVSKHSCAESGHRKVRCQE